jgi:ABC-type branched-subunit amino acid transport system substrate-binding protein
MVGISTPAGASGGKSTYLIGASEDLSGPLASYGKWAQVSWNAEFNAVNKAGGINGHPVKFVIRDDASVLTTAISNVKQFIGDHALVVTGSTLSNICAGVAPIATAAKTPVVCSTLPTTLLSPTHTDVFGRVTPGETLAQPTFNLLPRLTGKKDPSIGTYIVAAADAVQLTSKLTSLAQAKGWKVTDQEQASTQATSLDPAQIAKLAASNPDAIICYVADPLTPSLVKGLRADGYKGIIIDPEPDIVSMQGLSDPKFYEIWPNQIVSPTSTAAGAAAYIKTMKTAGISGTVPLNTGFYEADWLAAVSIVTALKNCSGTCTPAALASKLSKTMLTEPGLAPTWGYTPTNHNPVKAFYLYRWTNGKPQLVEGNIPVGAL